MLSKVLADLKRFVTMSTDPLGMDHAAAAGACFG